MPKASSVKRVEENRNAWDIVLEMGIRDSQTIIGAGSASGGTLDASNLLKPALSSGQLKCIGATTFTEFRNGFEKDHALARRFQKIDINEPTVEQTVQILCGLKSRFEDHHNVKYSVSALITAAELSARFINDRPVSYTHLENARMMLWLVRTFVTGRFVQNEIQFFPVFPFFAIYAK